MIGALATSGRVLARHADVEAARQAAGAVMESAGPAGALRHSPTDTKGSALLQDYAYLAEGLLDLHDATGEPRWRDDAALLVDAAISHLWDPAGGGFFGAQQPGPLRLENGRDTELPSANGVMASVLLRLGRATGETRYSRLAQKTIEAFLPELERDPRGMETLAAAAVDCVRGLPGVDRPATPPGSPGGRPFCGDPWRTRGENLERLQELTLDASRATQPAARICRPRARKTNPLSFEGRARGRSVLHGRRRTTCLPKRMERSAYWLTGWKLGPYDRTYPAYVEDEVRAALADPADLLRGPRTLVRRGSRDDDRGAFVVEDGRYLSARWPGDAYLLARRFGGLVGA
jgi:hypothetical protein